MVFHLKIAKVCYFCNKLKTPCLPVLRCAGKTATKINMQHNLKSFQVRWSDLDPNRHMANVSYSHFTNDTRVSYLASKGFTQQILAERNFGPVVFSEEFHYLSELHHGETFYVDVELLGNTEDQRFWKFCHTFFKADGKLACYSELSFGWLNLLTRKLMMPDADLLERLLEMPKAERYAIIPHGEFRTHKIPKKALPAHI